MMEEESISAASEKLEADNRIPLKDYYEVAEDLLKQADMYRKEKNLVDLYIILLRLASLVMETIPSHQDYKLKHQKRRHSFSKLVINVASELESLKAGVKFPVAQLKSDLDGPNKDTWDLTAALLKIPSFNQIHPIFGEEQSTTPTETQSSEKGSNEHDETQSGRNSESGSNGKFFLDEQGSCVPPADNQSLKQESRPDDSVLYREKILSEIEQKEEIRVNNNIYTQLQHALADIASLKQEVYRESCERLKAERDALKASRSAITSEKLYAKEKKQRIRGEEVLLDLVLKLETLKNARHELFQELNETQKQKESLEFQVAGFQEKLTASEHLIDSLQMERDKPITVTPKARNVLEFSYLELNHATQGFDDSMKIGERIYGSVYKGFLRHTTLAIKTDFQCMLTQKEFLLEVDTLSSLRHPNLVNLIGICPESRSLVFEFLPNGSLENYLDSPGNSKPLSWQVRMSAAAEICSTLIFLHSCKPDSIIHGNLKPSNILFDAHFASKLCDFHIHHWSSTASKNTEYVDPEFLSTGKLTTKSDIYSFGIILLRLLTGRPAFGIIEEVTDAMEKENLQDILDKSAGQWPFVQAKQLLHLGLRCCQSNSCDRPDLADDARRILEPMRRASTPGALLPSSKLQADDVPSYFMCPILQEVMTDPHVAADGFTYEAEAVKAWFDGGHNTSPMTNMKLPHQQLLPNHALRSVIQEWFQQKG